MKTNQRIIDQLPQDAADTLHAGGSIWDYYVGDLAPGTRVIAIALTGEGQPIIPSPEAQAAWREAKDGLRRSDASAYEDETVDMYRRLPTRERRIVDDLVRALHGRH